jgi:catechol 2,3-dioxygenase-like lactoylglutathione lyase family enzyme
LHIQELSLHTTHLTEQKAFYSATLDLPLLAETSNSFTVRAGATQLYFQEAQQDALYHIAFMIPHTLYQEAKSWIQRRMPLLLKDGKDEIFFSGLNARSFYFCDLVGNILEYIAYYDHDSAPAGAFSASSLLRVSEIGLPVEDVPALANLLREQFAIEPYGGSVSRDFAFLGDRFGQFVAVRIGRPWLPTDTVLATVAPVQVTINGREKRQVQLAPYPYTIMTTAS